MRRRILLTLLASTSIILVAFIVPMMVLLSRYAVDRYQRVAVVASQQLVSRIPVAEEAALDDLVDAFTEETGYPATIYLHDGTRIGAAVAPDQGVAEARTKGASFTPASGGQALYVPVYRQDGDAVLRVFVPDSTLRAKVLRARLIVLVLGAGLLALSVGLGLRLARTFLRPISQLGDTAEKLAGGDLTARVPNSTIPEIDTAGRGLNRLAGRVEELLGLEREEVADLAHRLRTPVAALRLDAEGLPPGDSADRLREDVDRLEKMVDEVIREARRPLREDMPASADLGRVARERTDFWAVLAEDQQRDLTVTLPRGPLYVAAEARDLGDALDALIGNVFSHTDEGVAFWVSVGRGEPGMAWVEIGDVGPGMPPVDVVARGQSVSGSTGLGLDIARRVAERAGGSIEVGRTREGGARVRLNLQVTTRGGAPAIGPR